jgi:hypothetical protein
MSKGPSIPVWVNMAEGRFLSGGLYMALNSWRIISTSFNSDWTCLRCGSHGGRPALKVRGEADSSCSLQAILLVDQSFPTILPAEGHQQCLKIISMENGSLEDLVDELFRQVGNRRVPPGTAGLIWSASHLGNVGTSAYAEDLVDAMKAIQVKYGKSTRVGPLAPALLGGCEDPALIRSIYEIATWSEHLFCFDATFLRDSHVVAMQIIMASGEGNRVPEECIFRLPNGEGVKKKVWSSGGKDGRAMPCRIKPLAVQDEKKLVITIIEELRNLLALDLDPSPTLERGAGHPVQD